MNRRLLTAALALAALALAAPAAAPALGPDQPARTPLARTPAAQATGSVSRTAMCVRLKARLLRASRSSGLFVIDTASGRPVCRRAGRKPRIPASNMKLFTTAATLERFGPEARMQTTIWGVGDIVEGTLQGSLYLVGGGDPALASPDFSRRFLAGLGTDIFGLTEQVTAAGIERVSGRLYADDTVFDRLRGVADSGFATSPYIGPLSGLSFNSGFADSGARNFASDPPIVAASRLAESLRASGVQVPTNVSLRARPPGEGYQIGVVNSPEMEVLANQTNIYSNNFYAEMLIKGLGARFGSGGSTALGATVVKRFARDLGSGVRAVDGSGLTRANRATPAQVARLLAAMRGSEAADEFANSLPVAGREGTVASRMRGTAAAGRCRTKTGTLSGVSALSGYCFNRTGKVMAFAILMNRISSLTEAHRQQDRMAALIARY